MLTAVYALIIVSQLAPLGICCAVAVPAVTGECNGECATCGCAPEQSAAHTCCCAKKMALESQRAADRSINHCEQTPVQSCDCARDDGYPPALWDADNLDLLPYHVSEGILLFREGALAFLCSNHRANRHGEPPDPPPKLAALL